MALSLQEENRAFFFSLNKNIWGSAGMNHSLSQSKCGSFLVVWPNQVFNEFPEFPP